ncbi:resolvase [Synechococcus sp. UW140]|uniref:resolvase n=1 Tax=Synechococcus sp. UW140 TaxID=368503 RepID=UPI00313781AF
MTATTPTAGGHWIGLDPGRSKCGLVRTDISGQQVQDLLVCTPQESWDWLQHWCHSCSVKGLVLGDGTGSGPWQQAIGDALPELTVVLQPEAGSTLAARGRYWQLFPPRNLWKLLPEGLRLPPRPLDDLAALVLLEAHLGHRLELA